MIANKVIKKSPFVIIKSLLLVEVTAVLLYLFIGFLGHYAQIYRSLPISDFISFQIAQALFIFIGQTVILVIVFLKWSSESYIFKNDQISYFYGIWQRKEKSMILENMESFDWHQGPLGRIAKYGHLVLKYKNGKKIILKYIPDAQKYFNHLNNLKAIKISSQIFKEAPDINELLSRDENESLEFKSSFRWDTKEGKVNKMMEKSAMKTVAAFLNSRGGHLVIGVDDGKNILGMEKDWTTLPKSNHDGFENHFTHIFHNMIGPTFRQYVNLANIDIGGKNCCVVSVSPSSNPVYLKSDDKNEEFYIRTGNGTTSLRLSEVNKYIRNRFRSL